MAGLGWAGYGWAWLGMAELCMAVLGLDALSHPFPLASSPPQVSVSGLWGENDFVSITNVLTIVVVQRKEASC